MANGQGLTAKGDDHERGSIMLRRDFLKSTSAAALLNLFPASLAGLERSRAAGQLERRPLGRTGERLSIVGFGGIVASEVAQEDVGVEGARRHGASGRLGHHLRGHALLKPPP